MIKSNYHTHTVYCDGKNTAKEMIDAAIKKDFDILGFSGHSPMDFENDWAMTNEKLKSYIYDISKYKKEYKDKIDILCGIELDADHIVEDISLFDFTIGSVHQFRDGKKDHPIDLSAEYLSNTVVNLFDGDWIKMSKAYYTRLVEFICKSKPDIVGHFDLVTKYNEGNRFFSEDSQEYQKVAVEAVDKILSECENIIFEVNTGAMYRAGKTVPYPAPFIMEHLKSKNAKITITSDSHCTESLDFAFDRAADYCKSFGFTKNTVITSEGIIETDL